MEDVRDLKELQLDALKEVANIGAGHAATALSQLTSRTIMINVPEVNVRPLEEVPELLGRAVQWRGRSLPLRRRLARGPPRSTRSSLRCGGG